MATGTGSKKRIIKIIVPSGFTKKYKRPVALR